MSASYKIIRLLKAILSGLKQCDGCLSVNLSQSTQILAFADEIDIIARSATLIQNLQKK